MQLSAEQTHWLVKVFQPEKTVVSLPGGASLNEASRASLLGLDHETYATELARLLEGAKQAARELLADSAVSDMLERLPLRRGAKVVVVGDSLTSDPQSWAVILTEMLAVRRPKDDISLTVNAVSGETTTHVLIRMGAVTSAAPDWVLFFIGLNDARTQGPHPTKTIVSLEETGRNLAELRERAARETKARRLWIAPPAVLEERVAQYWARFGVRFRNQDIHRVASVIRELGDSTVDLTSTFGGGSSANLFLEDGLHLAVAGQKQIALEVIRAWSKLE
jgi:lysophospholipase L1-like esterase